MNTPEKKPTPSSDPKPASNESPDETHSGRGFGDLLWGAVTDIRIFGGTLRLLGSVVLLLFLIVIVLLWLIRWLQPPITVRVTDSGAVEISTTKSTKTAMFLLSPNGGEDSPWIDTGITLTPGNNVTITASGKICMAYHHMVESAQWDTLPPVPWTGPEGLSEKAAFPPKSYRTEEAARKAYRVATDLPPGRLVAIVSSERPSSDPTETTKTEEGKPLDIGKKQTFTTKSTGHLWLTVNDIWLDPNMADAYKPQTPAEYKTKIEDPRYWNIWYDDNAGSFLVTIETSP